MSSVHPSHLHGQMAYACAQFGCQVCVERLLRQHQGLIHAVLQRQCTVGVGYVDLVQEGRIALWQDAAGEVVLSGAASPESSES